MPTRLLSALEALCWAYLLLQEQVLSECSLPLYRGLNPQAVECGAAAVPDNLQADAQLLLSCYSTAVSPKPASTILALHGRQLTDLHVENCSPSNLAANQRK